jgi:hypothetical protein
VRGAPGWHGVVQEHERPKKKLLTRIQSSFQTLVFLSFFHIKMPFFDKNISKSVGWDGGGLGKRW